MSGMHGSFETADTTAVAGDMAALGEINTAMADYSQGSSIQGTEMDQSLMNALEDMSAANSSMIDKAGLKEPSLKLVSDQSVEDALADAIPGLDPTTITPEPLDTTVAIDQVDTAQPAIDLSDSVDFKESVGEVLQVISSEFSDLSDSFEALAEKTLGQDATGDRFDEQDGANLNDSAVDLSSVDFDALQVSIDGFTKGIQSLLAQLENSFIGEDTGVSVTAGEEEVAPIADPVSEPADTEVVADAGTPAETELVAKPEGGKINAQTDTTTITGSDSDDIINAGNLTTTVTGGEGADVITGGDVAASLRGDAGVDLIAGGSADDTIEGGAGNDFLRGSGGNDQMSGGEGSDFFGFAQPTDGVDVFKDFKLNEDFIGVSNSGFTLGLDETNLLSQPDGSVIAAELFSKGNSATNETQRFVYNPDDGSFSFDADGSGTSEAVKLAQLDNGLDFANDDIRVFI
jgi:RTX calcium-binding nonapeptide repeat (4 copies)